MPRIEESIVIDRSPEDVFAFVTDAANDTKWQSDVVESEWLDDEETGPGRRMRGVNRFLGKKLEFVGEITTWDPPKQAAFKTVEGPFNYEGEYRVEPQDGGCRVTLTGEAESLGGVFGKLSDPIVAKMYGRQVRADLGNLKDIMESGAETGL